jgi:hypothetical protein
MRYGHYPVMTMEPQTHGVVAQPSERQTNSGFEPYRSASRIGLPTMTEASLIHAYRRCECAEDTERMPWESWSKGQWSWYKRRQRVMARRTRQLEARAEA